MTRFLVVRHGQSIWNAEGRWQGQADPPLSRLGIQQAQIAATRLPPHDRVAASTLQRAHRTASLLAENNGGTVALDARLRERDAGEFSGLTRDQIEERFPGYLAQQRWPRGWEPQEQLAERVLAALADLDRDSNDNNAADAGVQIVVSHGGVIYALEGLLGIEHQRVANLEGRWFTFAGGELSAGDRVHLLSSEQETTPDQL